MALKARTLWYTGVNQLEVREIDIPRPGAKEVLVKIDACGICTWDLVIYSGGFQDHKAYPFYFGHEGVGHVIETGSEVSRLQVGDRVSLRESATIGSIGYGHMATHALQNEATAILLPEDDIPAEHWLIEPVACCVNSINLTGVLPGQRVALVGTGFMGGILLQLLAMSPAAQIDVFDVRKESLDYALTLAPRGPISVYDSSKLPQDLALDGAYDVVFESAAVEPAFRLADRMVRRGGTLVIFSWHHHVFPVDLGSWHERGLRVLNTSPALAQGHMADVFRQSVPLIAGRRIEVGPLVTHVGSPEEAGEIFAKGVSKEDGYIKGVVRF